MRKEVYEYVISRRDVHRFIREQPEWYKILSRDPNKLKQCEKACLEYYQKTLPHRFEKIANGMQMATMMYSMFQAMNQQ